jgi:hypothetical protein
MLTQEQKDRFLELSGALSPENLCCDGMLPRHQVIKRARALHKEWAALEKMVGRKVSEEETWTFKHSKWR